MVWRLLGWAGVFVLVIGVVGWYDKTYPQLKYNSLWHKITHPTDTRVRYRIGTLDPRFGIDEATARQLSLEAENIWQQGTGKDWFVYDDTAQLTINFIYDERQANSTAKQRLEKSIEQQVNHHERQSAQLSQLRVQLDDEFEQLQQDIDDWQQDYFKLVYDSQANPNNPSLSGQWQNIEARKNILDNRTQMYQTSQDKYNALVDTHNATATTINERIDTANSLLPTQFHKGEFDGLTINIYEFRSHDDLRMVLAHELGHALDLGHNDDPKALMYPLAGEQDIKNFRLHPADIALLNSR